MPDTEASKQVIAANPVLMVDAFWRGSLQPRMPLLEESRLLLGAPWACADGFKDVSPEAYGYCDRMSSQFGQEGATRAYASLFFLEMGACVSLLCLGLCGWSMLRSTSTRATRAAGP